MRLGMMPEKPCFGDRGVRGTVPFGRSQAVEMQNKIDPLWR